MRKARQLAAKGRLAEARELYRKLCRRSPRDREAWLELSRLCRRLGDFGEAEQAARRLVAEHPDDATAWQALGAALHRQRRLGEALGCYQRSLAIDASLPETHYFLAEARREQGLDEEAEAAYRATLALAPDHVPALNNLSALLTNRGRLQEAAGLLQRALEIRPDDPRMLVNLGRARLHAGDAAAAEAAFRRVIELQPRLDDAHSNLLACLNYLGDRDPQAVFEDHRRWARVHCAGLRPPSHWPNETDPRRRLRIGYVSPDLREHSVARFLEPVLAHHRHEDFEIGCYADVAHPDATTERLRGHCDRWTDATRLSHEQLAERVRRDRVDILIDLAGHTAHNRLLMFARKPAPLQLSWLGYPNTTGLSAIDYRISDGRADPPGKTEALHSETLLRLPHSFLCYGPPVDAPACGAPPSLAAGHVTFGSFNNLAKTTPAVVRAWARILAAVPDSRLLLKSRATGDPATRERLLARFADAGIETGRIAFLDPVPVHREHLAAYGRIDIALDTFPYHGTTTTCEALWMGVPVITLAGRVHAARVGVSLLHQVGLDDLVTGDEEQYLAVAARLAADSGRLVRLRNRLRDRMRAAPLCDAAGFTAALEESWREIWQRWCSGAAAGG